MPKITHTHEIKVPFYDVDSMFIAWHGHYVKYFEEARCSLLSKIAYDYEEMRDSGFAWPVVELHIKYVKPLTFKQQIEVVAELESYEYGLSIRYVIQDKLTGKKLSKGRTKQVAVNMSTQELCLYSPSILLNKIEEYLNAQ